MNRTKERAFPKKSKNFHPFVKFFFSLFYPHPATPLVVEKEENVQWTGCSKIRCSLKSFHFLLENTFSVDKEEHEE